MNTSEKALQKELDQKLAMDGENEDKQEETIGKIVEWTVITDHDHTLQPEGEAGSLKMKETPTKHGRLTTPPSPKATVNEVFQKAPQPSISSTMTAMAK